MVEKIEPQIMERSMGIHKKLPAALRALPAVLLTFAFSHAQVSDTVRVICGGSGYTDALGKVWSADYGSTGGSSYTNTDNNITGTSDPTLYQSEEWADTQVGPFYYTFTLPQGNYTVRLLFAEIYTAWCSTGSRVFNVDINGTPVLQNFDIFATAGCDAALTQQFTAATVNGQITINFTNSGNLHPKISAIEIVPVPRTPIWKNPDAKQSWPSISNLNGGLSVQIQTEGFYTLELRNLQGKRIGQKHGFGSGLQSFTNLNPGLYLLTFRMDHQTVTRTLSVVR
jgi:hypothetical protein